MYARASIANCSDRWHLRVCYTEPLCPTCSTVEFPPSDGAPTCSLPFPPWAVPVCIPCNCRHTAVHAAAAKGVPTYAITLAASLAKSVAPVLGGGGGADGNIAARLLSVAAASLRFVLTVVVAASEAAEAPAFFGDCGDCPAGPPPPPTLAGRDSPSDRAQQQQQQKRQRHELGELLEVLWASGCLEACVHVVGDVPRRAPTSCG